MGLTKKGSRLITVDGRAYRWRIRRKPTYWQALASSGMTFAVELAQNPGAALVVTLAQRHPSNWMDEPAVPLVPATVADCIRTALAQGWTPSLPGKPFLLEHTASK